jgi:hypothetical protein
LPWTVTVFPTRRVVSLLLSPESCVDMLPSAEVWFSDCSTCANCASWVTKSVPCVGWSGSWLDSWATRSVRNVCSVARLELGEAEAADVLEELVSAEEVALAE